MTSKVEPVRAEAEPQSTPPRAAPPPPTPATWAADPYGRAEVRFWDGTRWTEHVATSGQQSVDPPA